VNTVTISYYIGYMSGDNGLLYPDFFQATSFEHNVGKPWGSYVWVAGPYKTERLAKLAYIGVKG
jgi:hypothetical protein